MTEPYTQTIINALALTPKITAGWSIIWPRERVWWVRFAPEVETMVYKRDAGTKPEAESKARQEWNALLDDLEIPTVIQAEMWL